MEGARRYLIRFSYIGTSYSGSARHCHRTLIDIDTVQGAIESSFLKLKYLFKPIRICLAGRTDAGVHALSAAAHFTLDEKSSKYFEPRELVQISNKYLIRWGHEIRILSCQEVSTEFHARISAKSRSYFYRFMISKNPEFHQIPVLEMLRTCYVRQYPKNCFDFERMKSGLDLFRGHKDFMTFSAETSVKKKTYKRTLELELQEAAPLLANDTLSDHFTYWHLIFKSNSFLYNQVRRIVGTLFALGKDKITEKEIMTMLQVPAHNNWPLNLEVAMPHGLYLLNVEYDKNDLQHTPCLINK